MRIGQSIMGGEDDATDTNVVAIIMTNMGGLCTGSLIAPNLVLTAHHCVSNTSEQVNCSTSKFGAPYAPGSFYVTFAQDVFQGGMGSFKKVAQVYVPPGSDSVCGYDVALVRLADNVDASVAEPLTPRVDVAVETGEEYRAVGYGNTNDTSGAGKRRMRDGLLLSCSGADCPGFYLDKDREFEGDTGICQGDSGGPALDTKNRVIGVVSRGAEGCTMPIYGSVYAWGDWIKEIAAQAAKDGKYEAAAWVTGGSTEPQPKPDGGAPDTGATEAGGQLGAPGVACKTPEECESNLCVYENDQTYYCSSWCVADAECPANWYCDKAKGACFQRGAFGEVCASPADCRSTLCVSADSKSWYCSLPCSEQQPCPTGSTCTDGVCFRPSAVAETSGGSSGGCATRAQGSERAWAAWAMVLALIVVRRRRARATC